MAEESAVEQFILVPFKPVSALPIDRVLIKGVEDRRENLTVIDLPTTSTSSRGISPNVRTFRVCVFPLGSMIVHSKKWLWFA